MKTKAWKLGGHFVRFMGNENLPYLFDQAGSKRFRLTMCEQEDQKKERRVKYFVLETGFELVKVQNLKFTRYYIQINKVLFTGVQLFFLFLSPSFFFLKVFRRGEQLQKDTHAAKRKQRENLRTGVIISARKKK